MMMRWNKRRSFQGDERSRSAPRGRDPPVIREDRPPLHPMKRTWTFEEDVIPGLMLVPTAKSFKSEDSLAQFREIKTGRSRYSVDDEEDIQTIEDDPPTIEGRDESAKDDKYLQGAPQIDLWSLDTDSMHAKWRSNSGDGLSPVRKPSPLRNRITALSPRWLQREVAAKPIANLSPMSEPSPVARKQNKDKRPPRHSEVRDPAPRVDSTESNVNGSEQNKSSRKNRKERAPRPEDVVVKDRKGRGRQKEGIQHTKTTSDSVKKDKSNGSSEGASDRSRNSKTSRNTKGSGSSKTPTVEDVEDRRSKKASKTPSAEDVVLEDRRSKKSSKPFTNHNSNEQSRMSTKALSRQQSDSSKMSRMSKKEENVASNKREKASEEMTKSGYSRGERSRQKKTAEAGPSMFDTLTSFNDSEYRSRLTTVQTAYSPEDGDNVDEDAPEELPAPVKEEKKQNGSIHVRYHEASDNSTISLLKRDVLVLTKDDQASKERDPPAVEAELDEKRYDPPTGKSWTSDVASSLTGSAPGGTLKDKKAAYSAFLAVPPKVDPVAVLRQEECEASLKRKNELPIVEQPEDPIPPVAPAVSFSKQRVRSAVIYPPAMKGLDPPSGSNLVDEPVIELKKSRSANIIAEPVVAQALVDHGELDENGEYSFKRSIIELCEPVAFYLMDGIRAVRNIDNGACDEPFTFLDCKTLECEDGNSAAVKATNTAQAESGTHQVLEAKSMKLDEEASGDDKQDKTKAIKINAEENKDNPGIPMSVIEIPTPKSFVIDDDSYTRSILGLEKIPKHLLLVSDDRARPPTPPRGRKPHRHGKDGHSPRDAKIPHKRSHSMDTRSLSKTEEKKKRRAKSTERVRFASPEPSYRAERNKPKKRGFFGKLFRRR